MDRNEPLIVTALVAGLVGLGGAQPVAATDTKPTVAVASFTGVGIEPRTGDAMADELAAQLVETGRYRVMPREWLKMPAAERPSLGALREAAAAAGVESLMLGEARHAMSLGTTRRDIVFMDVRVVSVATGDVVRTAAGRSQAAPPVPRPLPVAPMTRSRGVTGVVGHLAAAAASAHRAKHPTLPPAAKGGGWERPLADIARAITIPARIK